MTLLGVLAAIEAMDAPCFTTSDLAARLGITPGHASVSLRRLAAAGHVLRLRHAVWALPNRVDRLALPECLTAPFPAYVSLQSALYVHGMISQVPAVTYAVTLARTRRLTTPLGTVSLHHVQPGFFFGFESQAPSGGRLATPEKALVDFLYLTPARSLLFRALPELALPEAFKPAIARAIVQRISSAPRRALVSRKLETLLRARHSKTDLLPFRGHHPKR